MNYILGIDYGGTKTDCVIANFEPKILSSVTTKGGNLLKIGFEKAALNILSAIKKCIENTNIKYEDVDFVLIGSAGAGRKENSDKLLNELKRITDFKNIKVTTDAHIALEGAFSGKPGCILIAGTGSIIYGKDKEGKLYRVGGFGSLIGDQGGGYSIGRKGLIAVAKQLDEMGNNTKITDLVCDKFNIENKEDLISKVYGNQISISEIAVLVLDAAQSDDETAITILNEELDELIEQISAMKKKLNDEKFNLAFTGSLIQNKNYYSNLLREKIKEKLSFVEVTEAENPPAFGAILLAKKNLRMLNEFRSIKS